MCIRTPTWHLLRDMLTKHISNSRHISHTFTKTGRQRRASYATICQWMVDAWANVSVSSVVRVFTKAGIITEQLINSNKTDSDNDERDPGVLDTEIAQLLNADTEDQDFDGRYNI